MSPISFGKVIQLLTYWLLERQVFRLQPGGTTLLHLFKRPSTRTAQGDVISTFLSCPLLYYNVLFFLSAVLPFGFYVERFFTEALLGGKDNSFVSAELFGFSKGFSFLFLSSYLNPS